jgi:hypothetical protein
VIQYKGGDGSSKEKAVLILANNETDGVDTEYDYLDSRFGEYELVSQQFIGEPDKQYDLLRIRLPDGTEKEVWLDITVYPASSI